MCKENDVRNGSNEYGTESNAKIYENLDEDGDDIPDTPWIEPNQPVEYSSDEESVDSDLSSDPNQDDGNGIIFIFSF